MELKKSGKADLEGKRPLRFLLGLTIALALFFAALELPLPVDDPLDDPDLVEMLSHDAELPPLASEPDMVALAPKVEPPPATELKVVEEAEDEAPAEQPEEPVESDGGDDLPPADEPDAEEPPAPPPAQHVEETFRVVSDLPQFPGGPTALMKWLTTQLRYPPAAQRQQLQGKVVAEFIVEKDGTLSNIRIVKSLNQYCDHEALRVLRLMPRWTAGVENDQPCRTKVCIPIVFKL